MIGEMSKISALQCWFNQAILAVWILKDENKVQVSTSHASLSYQEIFIRNNIFNDLQFEHDSLSTIL